MKRGLALLLTLLLLVTPAAAFSDVADTAWYAPAVDYVQEKELMNGVGDGRFDPGGTVSRGMLAAVLWRMAGSPFSEAPLEFDDIRAGSWFADAVLWCSETGVVTGTDPTHFVPNGPVTREQTALMLWRFAGWPAIKQPSYFLDSAQINWWSQGGVDWAAQAWIITGKSDGTFDPQGPTTRAELAQMLMNFDLWRRSQAG